MASGGVPTSHLAYRDQDAQFPISPNTTSIDGRKEDLIAEKPLFLSWAGVVTGGCHERRKPRAAISLHKNIQP